MGNHGKERELTYGDYSKLRHVKTKPRSQGKKRKLDQNDKQEEARLVHLLKREVHKNNDL